MIPMSQVNLNTFKAPNQSIVKAADKMVKDAKADIAKRSNDGRKDSESAAYDLAGTLCSMARGKIITFGSERYRQNYDNINWKGSKC